MTDEVASLLRRCAALLDKGCVRYTDHKFEVERDVLSKEIYTLLNPPFVESQVLTQEEVLAVIDSNLNDIMDGATTTATASTEHGHTTVKVETTKPATKTVRLPVVK